MLRASTDKSVTAHDYFEVTHRRQALCQRVEAAAETSPRSIHRQLADDACTSFSSEYLVPAAKVAYVDAAAACAKYNRTVAIITAHTKYSSVHNTLQSCVGLRDDVWVDTAHKSACSGCSRLTQTDERYGAYFRTPLPCTR